MADRKFPAKPFPIKDDALNAVPAFVSEEAGAEICRFLTPPDAPDNLFGDTTLEIAKRKKSLMDSDTEYEASTLVDTGTKGQVKIIQTPESLFAPKIPPDEKFIENINGDADFLDMIGAYVESKVPLLLVGEKGIGKTLAIASYAAGYRSDTARDLKTKPRRNPIPLIQFDCSENTRASQLLGRFLLRGGGEIVFQLGVIPMAINIANHCGQCVLVFEEINALNPNMQKVLNQLLDWRKHAHVPDLQRGFGIDGKKPFYSIDKKPPFGTPDFIGSRLLVAATMNPSGYGGVSQLNEDLKSRFSIVYVEYPDPEYSMFIMDNNLSSKEFPYKKSLNALAQETQKQADKFGNYVISTREMIQTAKVYFSILDDFSMGKTTKDELETAEKRARYLAFKNCLYNKYDKEGKDDSDGRKAMGEAIHTFFVINVKKPFNSIQGNIFEKKEFLAKVADGVDVGKRESSSGGGPYRS